MQNAPRGGTTSSLLSAPPLNFDHSVNLPPPPQAEVEMVWREARPLHPDQNPDLCQWLTSRAINPANIARFDLARALTPDQALPPWAGFAPSQTSPNGRSWFTAGFTLVIPQFTASGQLASLTARTPTPKGRLKSAAPLGYGRKGLCFASGFEAIMLRDAAHQSDAVRARQCRAWVLLEGEMDFLTWAAHESNLTPAATATCGFIGVQGGGFDATWARSLARFGVAVHIKTHHDLAGDKMAAKIGRALWSAGVTALWRGAKHDHDENARAIANVLYPDPLAGALAYTPPLAVEDDQTTLDLPVVDDGADPAKTPPSPREPVQSPKPAQQPRAASSRKERPLTNDERLSRFATGYIRAAIERGAQEVAATEVGDRDNALFRVAANTARFADRPEFDRIFWRDSMWRAGLACGLARSEVEAAMLSAWRAAKTSPPHTDTLMAAWRGAEAEYARKNPAPQAQDQTEAEATFEDLGWVGDAAQDEVLPAKPPNAPVAPQSPLGGGGGESPADAGDESRATLDFTAARDLPPETFLSASPLDSAFLTATPVRRELVVSHDLSPMVDQALEDLVLHRHEIYCRGGLLVRLKVDERRTPSIEEIPIDALVEASSSATCWVKEVLNRQTGEIRLRGIRPDRQVLMSLAARAEFPGVKPLRGVMRYPVITETGKLLGKQGYHAAEGLFVFPSVSGEGIVIPDAECTKENARAALNRLLDLFSDCDFAEASHRTVGVSLLLTHLIRHMVDTVPLFVVDAATPGTGKSTIFQIVLAITVGERQLPVVPPCDTTEEEAKRMLGWGMAGEGGMAIFDNVATGGQLGNAVLDGVLTSGRIQARLLSKNINVTANVDKIFCATGNNIKLKGDLHRRTIFARLARPAVAPELRQWKYPDIVGHAAAKRAEYMRDALLILRAWALAGLPSVGGAKLPSFDTWARWARDPLLWLGELDLVEGTRAAVAAADSTTSAFGGFLRTLGALTRGQPLTVHRVKQLYDLAISGPDDDVLSQDFIGSCAMLGFLDGERWKSMVVQRTLCTYQDRAVAGLVLSPVVQHQRWKVIPA